MLFAPWGDYGRQYRIENEAQVRSIERGVKAFGVAALPLVCALLLIAILRRRLPAAVLGWSLLVVFVSLAIAVTTFAIWARLISGRLTQADTVSLVTSSASAAARLTLQAQPQVPPCDVVGTARGILRNLTADLRDSHGVGAESFAREPGRPRRLRLPDCRAADGRGKRRPTRAGGSGQPRRASLLFRRRSQRPTFGERGLLLASARHVGRPGGPADTGRD